MQNMMMTLAQARKGAAAIPSNESVGQHWNAMFSHFGSAIGQGNQIGQTIETISFVGGADEMGGM